jgi:NTP pyrophosphatase (non-canonical NTP hydrolase)
MAEKEYIERKAAKDAIFEYICGHTQNEPTNKSPLDYIVEHLSAEDLLCQIAEEASELSQAALKLRRDITQTNPTPVTPKDATKDLIEEYGDVMNAVNAFLIKKNILWTPTDTFQKEIKLIRWEKRLREKLEG